MRHHVWLPLENLKGTAFKFRVVLLCFLFSPHRSHVSTKALDSKRDGALDDFVIERTTWDTMTRAGLSVTLCDPLIQSDTLNPGPTRRLLLLIEKCLFNKECIIKPQEEYCRKQMTTKSCFSPSGVRDIAVCAVVLYSWQSNKLGCALSLQTCD